MESETNWRFLSSLRVTKAQEVGGGGVIRSIQAVTF